jgi:hypothetical protein
LLANSILTVSIVVVGKRTGYMQKGHLLRNLGIATERKDMAVEFEMRKWSVLVKLEGYTTPSSAQALVQKVHAIIESFQDDGVDVDVFMLLEDENGLGAIDEQIPRKPDRLTDRKQSD